MYIVIQIFRYLDVTFDFECSMLRDLHLVKGNLELSMDSSGSG